MFKWNKKRRLALSLIIEGEKDQAGIAVECGVSKRLIQYWLAEPEFELRRKEIEDARVMSAKRRFQAAAEEAAQTVITLSRASTRDDAVRLQASMAILKCVGIAPDKAELSGSDGKELVIEVTVKKHGD